MMDALREVHPDLFISVPRFTRKLYAGGGPRSPPVLADAGGRTAGDQDRRALGRPDGRADGRVAVADRPGGGRPVGVAPAAGRHGRPRSVLVSDPAPCPVAARVLPRAGALGFGGLRAIGIPVAMNRPEVYRFGTVGHPLPQNHLRLQARRRIFIKGPGVSWYHGESATRRSPPTAILAPGTTGSSAKTVSSLSAGRRSALIKRRPGGASPRPR